MTDSQGISLTCGNPVAGNHHDSYQLVQQVEKMWKAIESINIPTDGLFINADAGFDSNDFRNHCFSIDKTPETDRLMSIYLILNSIKKDLLLKEPMLD